jgi:hypothetical protein
VFTGFIIRATTSATSVNFNENTQCNFLNTHLQSRRCGNLKYYMIVKTQNKQKVMKITNPPLFLTLFNIAVINMSHLVKKLFKGDTQTDRKFNILLRHDIGAVPWLR